MKLIDKDTALKEIEKLIEEVNPIRNKVGVVGCSNVVKYLQKVISLLNSLEVKEVDSMQEEDLPISHNLTEEGLLTFKDGSQAIIKKID